MTKHARLSAIPLAFALTCSAFAPMAPFVTAQSMPADPALQPGLPALTQLPAAGRTEAPNTDSCPFAVTPAAPVDTSEAVAPGQPSPTPLPRTAGATCGAELPPGFTIPKEVLASAFVVSDLDTGEIVAQKDPHGRYRPASIIKVLLATVVINELDPNKQITVSDESANIDGSKVGIGGGGVYTVDQLLHGLLMVSGNDAAHALAQALGGNEVTLKKINELAASYGAKDTYAASYSGLDAPGMSTSAHDLAVIYTHAYNNKRFADLVHTKNYAFPGYADHPLFEIANDNGLLINDPTAIGGKTGFTDDAHHTYVGAVDRNGHRMMAVLLDTTVDSGLRAWQQAQLLLNEAYTTQGRVGKLELNTAATGTPATSTDDAANHSTSSVNPGPTAGLIVGAMVLAGAAATFIASRRKK